MPYFRQFAECLAFKDSQLIGVWQFRGQYTLCDFVARGRGIAVVNEYTVPRIGRAVTILPGTRAIILACRGVDSTGAVQKYSIALIRLIYQ